MNDLEKFLVSAESLIQRAEKLLPSHPYPPEWENSIAFRWRKSTTRGELEAIRNVQALRLHDIQCVEQQKTELDRNTRQFLVGLPANNALLWGSRGTGKSSLIKAMLREYSDQGLRLIEVSKQQLIDLHDILSYLYDRHERFILFCDDLSFEANDPSYIVLKAALDGCLSGLPENVLIYATSNRRHLLPEYTNENLESHHVGGELHHGESSEEKISVSERFGIWLAFHPFTQDQYLSVVEYWLVQLEAVIDDWESIRKEALRWALKRGSRSGRIAWQFARDYCGRSKLEDCQIGVSE